MLTGENWIELFDIILALGFFLEGKTQNGSEMSFFKLYWRIEFLDEVRAT